MSDSGTDRYWQEEIWDMEEKCGEAKKKPFIHSFIFDPCP